MEDQVPPRGGLFLRALAAFLILPGMVAFLLPWLFRPRGATLHATGIPLLGVGTALLLWCVRDFYIAGRGTLAPWSPPTRLVIVGLYRWTRNPMYVAVVMILCGWAVAFHSRGLWNYTAAVAIGFHLRVVLFEEPWLARTFGDQWFAYRSKVPRWLFRVTGSS
jgi:protein-S-isoprenylcysteine O-methyltransferase Ste14